MASIPAKITKKKFIGPFRLGWVYVDLWVDPDDSGGRVEFCVPPNKGNAVMTIGLRQRWFEVVDTLLHESLEAVMFWSGHAYNKDGRFNNGSAQSYFHFSHPEYQEMCARVGPFLSETMPLVSTAYRKLTKRKK